jgi:hypothetical protein
MSDLQPVPDDTKALLKEIVKALRAIAAELKKANERERKKIMGALPRLEKEPGARLKIQTNGLGKAPSVELDGVSLNHCLTSLSVEWTAGEVVVANLTIGVAHVDIDALTLIELIAKTESPTRIEEAIRALKRLKAGV